MHIKYTLSATLLAFTFAMVAPAVYADEPALPEAHADFKIFKGAQLTPMSDEEMKATRGSSNISAQYQTLINHYGYKGPYPFKAGTKYYELMHQWGYAVNGALKSTSTHIPATPPKITRAFLQSEILRVFGADAGPLHPSTNATYHKLLFNYGVINAKGELTPLGVSLVPPGKTPGGPVHPLPPKPKPAPTPTPTPSPCSTNCGGVGGLPPNNKPPTHVK